MREFRTMALLIHLLRHAEAEDRSESGRDEDRALSSAGTKRMLAIASGIARLEVTYTAIYISPLLRARQTAEPVARACGFAGALKVTKSLVPEASVEAILHEVGSEAGKDARILLVGHQPHLGRLFGRLCGGGADFEIPMKKASLAAFEVGGDPVFDRAQLLYFLPPRVLEKLAPGS